jgi:hypothetical protein
MGYAELPGFRAGICTTFKFYDLKNDQATNLTVHPITYMDGSFIEDMHLDPFASLEHIRKLVKTVKRLNGDFLCIWHNHTISNEPLYKGWRAVFNETLQILNENQ